MQGKNSSPSKSIDFRGRILFWLWLNADAITRRSTPASSRLPRRHDGDAAGGRLRHQRRRNGRVRRGGRIEGGGDLDRIRFPDGRRHDPRRLRQKALRWPPCGLNPRCGSLSPERKTHRAGFCRISGFFPFLVSFCETFRPKLSQERTKIVQHAELCPAPRRRQERMFMRLSSSRISSGFSLRLLSTMRLNSSLR